MSKQTGGKKPAAVGETDVPVGTRYAPWMAHAQAETGKKVHELPANDGFVAELQQSLQLNARMLALGEEIASFGSAGYSGNGRKPEYSLLKDKLKDPVPGLVGGLHAKALAAANPEIDKYFAGLKTDPAYDKKRGKSYDIASTYGGEWSGGVTPWCAAFVNWCLKQAGAPYLNYATAKSWLAFGQQVSHPVYGCVTVIRPSKSTGSTTGHVAFYVRHKGSRIVLLGGNQRDQVKESEYPESWVQKDGYRWPTTMDDYLGVSADTWLLGLKRSIKEMLSPK